MQRQPDLAYYASSFCTRSKSNPWEAETASAFRATVAFVTTMPVINEVFNINVCVNSIAQIPVLMAFVAQSFSGSLGTLTAGGTVSTQKNCPDARPWLLAGRGRFCLLICTPVRRFIFRSTSDFFAVSLQHFWDATAEHPHPVVLVIGDIGAVWE